MPDPSTEREPGMSVRLKLTLSYAGVIVLAGGLLLAVVWVFLLRYVPATTSELPGPFGPNRWDLIRAFVPPAAWAMVFLLAFGLIGGWMLAGAMLAPLGRITNATRKAASGSLSHRIELEGRSDEFRELADAFDAMLARLEAHDAEQQRFAANASHELRTPLAITQTLLDVARTDPDRDPDELDQAPPRGQHPRDRAHRSAADAQPRRRGIVRARARRPVAARRGGHRDDPSARRAAGRHDRDLRRGRARRSARTRCCCRLTTNLVHNAVVHNLPEGGTVQVTTEHRGDSVMLTVENTGEKLTPQLVSTLTEPFRRGTERIHADHGGVGLGLAIAKSIVQAHHGTLAIEPRPEGGLLVTATFAAVAYAARRLTDRLRDREVEVGVGVRLIPQRVVPPLLAVRDEPAVLP